MIRALSFCKSYSSSKKPACKDINFEAERGKITVLLGPNGAGKSTLLKALSGFHYASSGHILVEGNDGAIFDAAEAPQEVKAVTGFISEVPALYDDWTVEEFLEAAAALRLAENDGKTINAAAKKAARLCNLDAVLKQKISSLSHGYKQRVNFAQALVHDPQILILDEPATGLDPEQIREMRELVQSLKKGRAIVFSTHIIQEAEALADKIYIIKDAAVVACGSPKELIKASGKSSLEDAYLFFAATGAASTDSSLAADSGASNDSTAKTAAAASGLANASSSTPKNAAAFFRLIQKELFAYAINPFYWMAALVFALFSAAAFFFGTRFFVQGAGSASLAPFFLTMPYVLSVFVPAFCMNIRSRLFDQSLPFGEFQKGAARLLAGLFVFALCLLPTILIPVCVSFFGSVDGGAVLVSYAGLLFFFAASISFCVFLSGLLKSRAAYFAFSVLALAAINFMHNILTYVQLGDFLSGAIRSMSFAWRFDSASKGILDSRDFLFFALLALLFLVLNACVLERKKGKKYFAKRRAFRSWTIVFIFVFLFLDASRAYKRFDFSEGKNYSPSERTKKIISGAQEKIRISYYRSSELLKLYPQVRDVGDFLRSLCASCKNISYAELDASRPAAAQTLKELSVQPLQLQSQKENSLEYVNAYSAIVIDYMDKTLYIPAAFSTFGLEYDLNLRLDYLTSQKSRRAYIVCANGMDAEKDYKSALEWLNLEGFETTVIKASDLPFKTLDASVPMVLVGSKDLDLEGAAAVERFLESGGSVLAMLSPYTVDINGSWSVSKNKGDFLLPIFERFGISFVDSLCADLSCVRANFYSSEPDGKQGENKSVNYPLWINILPQESAPYGVNVFWASPLTVEKTKAKEVLFSSSASWRFLPDKKNPDLLFDTNPFTVPKSAIADPLVQKEASVLAAKSLDKKLFVISGDLFANDLLLALSGGENGDFRNFNYLTTSLLELSGESDMAALKNKGAADFSLWKITSGQEWQAAKNLSIFLNFAAAPIAILILMAVYFARRKAGK
ncbi:MAG: Gldg family protein [Treponema sp.]|nr:Gldg family protein [Treponema sp.]